MIWLRSSATLVSELCLAADLGEPTIVKACHAQQQAPSLRFGRISGIGELAACLQRLELMFAFDSREVNVDILHPQLPYGIDPGGIHGLDIGTFLGDMAVFWGVVVADNEMGHVGGEVVLVDSAELFGLFGYFCLKMV